jgi:hypothetical protein
MDHANALQTIVEITGSSPETVFPAIVDEKSRTESRDERSRLWMEYLALGKAVMISLSLAVFGSEGPSLRTVRTAWWFGKSLSAFFTNARPRVLLAPVNTMFPIDMVASDMNGVFVGWSKAFSSLHINKRSRCGRF